MYVCMYVCMLEEALTLDDFNWLLLRHARLVHVFVRVVCVCCMVHGVCSVSITHAVLLVVVCYLLRSCAHTVWCARARAAVYGIVSCGGIIMDIAGGVGGGIIGVDGGRRQRTVVVVRVID